MVRLIHHSLSDFLIILYLTIGSTILIPYFDIILGWMLVWFCIPKASKVMIFYFYFSFLFLFTSFLLYDTAVSDLINRGAKILSIYFAIGSLFIKKRDGNLMRIKHFVLFFFKLLGIVIIVDALSYVCFKTSLWPPMDYLGFRFAGPFFDPNFLALFYGIVFVYSFGNMQIKFPDKCIYGIVFLLSLSWSAIILVVFSILCYKLFTKSAGLNQFIICIGYCFFLFLILKNIDVIERYFMDIFSYLLGIDTKLLQIKFGSLIGRFESQQIVFESFNFLGHGPHSILKCMPRDTHNSYLGYLFEMGVINLLFLLGLLLGVNKTDNRFVLRSSLFFILIGLFLNVHYTVAYPLIFLLALSDKDTISIREKSTL